MGTTSDRLCCHIGLFCLVDDFIVDEMGRPINRKKGREQGTDM